MAKPTTITSMNAIWKKLIKYIKNDPDGIAIVADGLNNIAIEYYVYYNYSYPVPSNLKGIQSAWKTLMKACKDDEDSIVEVSECFHKILESLLGADFFGTEG